MLYFNIQAVALAAQVTWRRSLRPFLLQDFVVFPCLGILGVIFIWWMTSLFAPLLPTPWEALTRGKLQRQVLNIWESHRQAVMMITHDVDEALYMSDRIILMTNGPAARIGEILEVPFPHPRNIQEIRELPEYYDLRNHALNFLDRHFAQEE